jgi:hypothetical protein
VRLKSISFNLGFELMQDIVQTKVGAVYIDKMLYATGLLKLG